MRRLHGMSTWNNKTAMRQVSSGYFCLTSCNFSFVEKIKLFQECFYGDQMNDYILSSK